MAEQRERPEPDTDEQGSGQGSVQATHEAPTSQTSTQRSTVVRDARTALASGQQSAARDLLEAHLEVHRDPEAMKALGEVLHRMGDLPGAGAAWFATSARGPLVDEAVAAWRADLDDDFVAMWASIPSSGRREPLTPKMAALRAKALEADPTLDDPHPADHQSPTQEQLPAAPRRREEARDREPLEPSPGEVMTDKASAPDRPAPVPKADDPHEGGVGVGTEGSGGFDAARVIAWILAALFVVCAVVGLITILQWIVPGS